MLFHPLVYITCFSVYFLVQGALALSSLSKLPPHAGFHGAAADPKKPFFEGWYLRVVTKNQGSIALIFHVFDPHNIDRPSRRRGVGIQVITPSGSTFLETPDLSTFRAESHALSIRNYFADTNDFFRLTSSRASGRISPISSGTGVTFDFEMFPEVGWGGDEGARQYSTAGWLAAFPVFEPHYQVLVSKGKAMGSLTLQGQEDIIQEYNLDDASIYLEKNWGGSFPSKWWWIQANTFRHSNLCVTSTGAQRGIPFLGQEEEVALIGLHWNGKFYPFPDVNWNVRWGHWLIEGSYGEYSVQIAGDCQDSGIPVKCPTTKGMEEIARESFHGTLRVQLFKNGSLVLDDTSNEACLEVGGIPWTERSWIGTSEMKEPIKTVAMNVELEEKLSNLLEVINTVVEIPGL